MRKFLGILLLLSVGIPYAGTFLWLKHTKKLVRKEIKWKMIEGLNREDLVLLKFTESETRSVLIWKHSKEFEFRGQMYDIVEAEHRGDSVYYWCWWDHEETRLNKQLNELVAHAMGKNQASKENSRRIIDFLKILYYKESSSFLIATHELICKDLWASQPIYHSIGKSPPAPPPKIA